MITLLSHKLYFHLYSVLPYLSFILGIFISIIFIFFYIYSKNKIFLYFLLLGFSVALYNICIGNLYILKTETYAIVSLKHYFLFSTLTTLFFILTIYKVIERDFDIYMLFIVLMSLAHILIVFHTRLVAPYVVKVGNWYRLSLDCIYYYFFIGINYIVILFGLVLLMKNLKGIHDNINIPLFVQSFFISIIIIVFLSITDILNILGFIKIPPLLSVGYIIYFLVMLFEVARSQVIYYAILKKSYLQTIIGLADLIDSRDKFTFKHSFRVSVYAVMLAEKMNLDKNVIQHLRTAALLHDIGKIGISDKILLKKGKLNLHEWAQMKKHPEKGDSILRLVSFLSEEAKIVRYHHEKYNGAGYPYGICDEDIPKEVEILAIADAFDAMTSDRPYRKRLTLKQVHKELQKQRGRQFSHKIVDLLMDNWDEMKKLYQRFAHEEKLLVQH